MCVYIDIQQEHSFVFVVLPYSIFFFKMTYIWLQ